ncbi:MAG: hypothetical protein AAFO29_17060, partial [Actinomycetota bacterium]
MPDLDDQIRDSLRRLTAPAGGDDRPTLQQLGARRRRRARHRVAVGALPLVVVVALAAIGFALWSDNGDMSVAAGPSSNAPPVTGLVGVVETDVVGDAGGTTRVVMRFDGPLPAGGAVFVDDIVSVDDPAEITWAVQDPESAHVCDATHDFGALAVGTVDLLIPAGWFKAGDESYTSPLTRIGEPPKFVVCGPHRGYYQYSIWGPASADPDEVTVALDAENGRLTIEIGPDDAETLPRPSGDERVDALDGDWGRPPTALGGSELVPLLVPFDDRLFILYTQNGGQEVAGEIYDPASGTADLIADSGHVWRYNPAVAWTGSELLIVGGSSGPAIDDLVLAYDPDTDDWRTLTNPPGDVDAWDNSIGGPGVWTGEELLIWQHGLAFNPTTDTWRTLARYPGPPRSFPASVSTDDEIIVWGGCDASIPQCDDLGEGLLTDGVVYEIETDTWRVMSSSPLAAGVHPVAVLADDAVLFYAGDTTASPSGLQTARYDPATERWTALGAPPIQPRRYATAAWTGQDFEIGRAAGRARVLMSVE